MPTGYTAALMEKGQTFPEFAMLCARAFGATIEMRDEPIDAPIPVFEPRSYHAEALEESRAKLAGLLAMTDAEKIVFGKKHRADAIKYAKRSLAKSILENERIDEMAHAVSAWTPPDNHKEFKAFMLNQLKISRNDTSYAEKSLAEAKVSAPVDYYAKAITSEEWSIKYHAENHEAEKARTSERNKWVSDLRQSLATN